MPRYRIHAVSGLYTEIVPYGHFTNIPDGMDDFDDDSSYGYRELDYDVELAFTVEAESEDAARESAEELVRDLVFRSDDGIEWELSDDREITDIDRIYEPMTEERAIEILQAFQADLNRGTDTSVDASIDREELRRAILFILDRNAFYRREREEAAARAVTQAIPSQISVGTSPTA